MSATIRQRLNNFLLQTRQNASFELPLLPLAGVLFPGGQLSLQVFEPRYIDMLKTCLRESKPFGLCLIRDDSTPAEPESIGCVTQVLAAQPQADGTLNITGLGVRRFHIETSHLENSGLIWAKASNITPEPSLPLPSKHQACATVLRRIIGRLGEQHFSSPLRYDDMVWVGYRLAELLPLKLKVRQDMLEMNDSLVRIEILHAFLTQQGLLD